MPHIDGDVVDLGIGPGYMKDHEARDERPPRFVFDFGQETRRKAFVVNQAIIAILGPVRGRIIIPIRSRMLSSWRRIYMSHHRVHKADKRGRHVVTRGPWLRNRMNCYF